MTVAIYLLYVYELLILPFDKGLFSKHLIFGYLKQIQFQDRIGLETLYQFKFFPS